MRSIIVPALALAGALASACGPGRTAAATQPSPVAFDPAKSDAKAVALADEVLAAIGGDAAYAKAKQIVWTQKVIVDGATKLDVKHYWDRWNGRHRFETVAPGSNASVMVAYDVFGSMAWGEIDGRGDLPRDRVAQMKGEAVKRLGVDAFTFLLPYKLKDPGVVLKYVEERASAEVPDKPAFDVIKMSFEGTGPSPGDVYYVVIDKETKLVRHIEFVETGKPDDQRIGYRFDDWQEIGGLKLSLKRQNIGYAGEVVEFSDVKVGEPSDELYTKGVE